MEYRVIRVSEYVYKRIQAVKALLIGEKSRNVTMSEALDVVIDFWKKNRKVRTWH